jgi:hypothetical protein
MVRRSLHPGNQRQLGSQPFPLQGIRADGASLKGYRTLPLSPGPHSVNLAACPEADLVLCNKQYNFLLMSPDIMDTAAHTVRPYRCGYIHSKPTIKSVVDGSVK